MAVRLRILEREQGGRGRVHNSEHGGEMSVGSASSNKRPLHIRFMEFAAEVFLPAGYPASVSPDYLQYQVFNALQAFCSSLAGLLSSRAVLEGFGVGKADASATHALLLTVMQDFFSRITTICAAYTLGPSLSSEAKTFRLLADVFNDVAIVLDTLSPLFASKLRIPGLRIGALCLSGALRALCGIAAGGSKAALAVHFATPARGTATGDVGDLNAKDSSKETVLALGGMLVGSLIVPYLTNPWTTYPVLFTLVALHLALNYLGIRGVVLRTLNRQRLTIAWELYHSSASDSNIESKIKFASPFEVSKLERILECPGVLRGLRGDVAGTCTMGSSLNDVLGRGSGSNSKSSSTTAIPLRLLEEMKGERYVLWFDCASLSSSPSPRSNAPDESELRLAGVGPVHLHICLKEGHAPADTLRSWAHAVEVALLLEQHRANFSQKSNSDFILRAGLAPDLILAAYRRVAPVFPDFLEGLRGVGWNTVEPTVLTGAPRALIVSIETAEPGAGLDTEYREEKKKEK